VNSGEFWYIRTVTFIGFFSGDPANSKQLGMFIATAPTSIVNGLGIGNTRIRSHLDTVLARHVETIPPTGAGSDNRDIFDKINLRHIAVADEQINFFLEYSSVSAPQATDSAVVTLDIFITDTLASVP
jgi:hypothetical protein